MIVTTSIPYNRIKKQLKKTDKIGIVSCNGCARICYTGGEQKMKELTNNLKKEGFNVVDTDLIGFPCDIDQLNKNELHGDMTIVLACDAGVYNLQKIFSSKKHKIIPGLVTVGLGAIGKKDKISIVKRFK